MKKRIAIVILITAFIGITSFKFKYQEEPRKHIRVVQIFNVLQIRPIVDNKESIDEDLEKFKEQLSKTDRCQN